MTIYHATNGKIAFSSTSLETIGGKINSSGQYLRNRFSTLKTDVVRAKGFFVSRTTLQRIKGRGNGLKRA